MIKTLLLLFVITSVAVLLIIRLGPRPRLQPIKFSALPLPSDLNEYLSREESKVPHLRAGTEKKIVWNSADHAVTDVSLVYLHGFSASRGEVSPVMETLAKTLHANLFFTRLRGHGQDSHALATATATEWLEDVNEAWAIGSAIGRKVVLAGTSTGATLALWAVSEGAKPAALIFFSPNFYPKDSRAGLLLLPFGLSIAKAITGPTRSWEPKNELQSRSWTHEYPIEALLPMMELVDYIAPFKLSAITTPTLIFTTDNDETVNVPLIRKKFNELGSPEKRLIEVPNASGHVLAGDAASPASTAFVESECLSFLKKAL